MSLYARINTVSKENALFVKRFLEAKTGGKFDIAISTRNYLMLDFDCDENIRECYLEAIDVAKTLNEEFNKPVYMYRTRHGFHLVVFHKMSWKLVRNYLRQFLAMINKGVLKYLDPKHIEASLRRGYITLRLNQITLLRVIK